MAADGSDREDGEGRDKLEALFGAGKPIPQHPGHAHPSRRRAAAAGMPIGRLVRTNDFGHINDLRENGIPGVMAPPRHGDPGMGAPALVLPQRSMTGLAANSRSNSLIVDTDLTGTRTYPLIQFNGTIDDTDMLTIMLLGPVFVQSPPPPFANPAPLAQITFGTGNAQAQVTVDWLRGTLITIPANFLEVSLILAGRATGTPAPAKFSIGVAYGAVPGHRNRCTRTFIASLGNGASTTMNIPDFSVGVDVVGSITNNLGDTGTVAQPLVLFMADQIPGALRHTTYTYTSGSNLAVHGAPTFPVPAGMNVAKVTNGSGSDGAIIQTMFELAF